MSRLRICVEHGFEKVAQLWENTGYSKGLRIGIQPVGAMYMIAVLLTNIHMCLNGSQVSTAFNCALPALENYLHYVEESVDTLEESSDEVPPIPSNFETD